MCGSSVRSQCASWFAQAALSVSPLPLGCVSASADSWDTCLTRAGGGDSGPREIRKGIAAPGPEQFIKILAPIKTGAWLRSLVLGRPCLISRIMAKRQEVEQQFGDEIKWRGRVRDFKEGGMARGRNERAQGDGGKERGRGQGRFEIRSHRYFNRKRGKAHGFLLKDLC